VSRPGVPIDVRPLSSLRGGDEPSFGGKSSALGELLAAGIRVPAGFALPCEASEHFIAEAGLEPKISAALQRARGGELAEVTAAAHQIAGAMRAVELPQAVRAAVAEHYRRLAEDAGDAAPAVAVRSSAIGEDSAEAAFAGQQETYLWVRGADAVCDALRDCWISLYSAEAISYRAHLGGERRAAMGVAVQLMVDAHVAGVMFTCNPVTGDPSMIAINASWGLGPAIVGGEVTPDDLLVSKVTGEVVRETVSQKLIEYVPDSVAGAMERREVPPERAGAPCLDGPARAALLELARAAERHFGSHQDIEFAIARTGAPPENVFVVQSRPVTGVAPRVGGVGAAASALGLVMQKFGAGGA
jgi:pyruvate,water dikinase